MLIENETKVLPKNLQEKKRFAGKSRIVSFGHQPLSSPLVGASLQPISNRGGEKALERICPSHPPFVLCPAQTSLESWRFTHWFIWETRGILAWGRAESALSPLPLICCTASGNSLNFPASSCRCTFCGADFSVGPLLNNICISYVASPPSPNLFAAMT